MPFSHPKFQSGRRTWLCIAFWNTSPKRAVFNCITGQRFPFVKQNTEAWKSWVCSEVHVRERPETMEETECVSRAIVVLYCNLYPSDSNSVLGEFPKIKTQQFILMVFIRQERKRGNGRYTLNFTYSIHLHILSVQI